MFETTHGTPARMKCFGHQQAQYGGDGVRQECAFAKLPNRLSSGLKNYQKIPFIQ
jgi:hypothetical protein